MKPRSILVTGGRGFLGSHLTERLASYQPKRIVCLDVREIPFFHFQSKKLFDNVISIRDDVRYFTQMVEVLSRHDIDTVFHLAAQPLVTKAIQKPLETITTNVMGTANLLEACRLKGGLKSIVIASSDKAYGRKKKLPYKENDPLMGDSPYDFSKTATDLISQAYFKTYGLPITIIRAGNFYGPGDTNFDRIIPGIFKSVIKKSQFLIRSDGKMVRAYIYVGDVVDGFIKAAVVKEAVGEAFNLGSNDILNVIEVIKRVEKLLNVDVKFKILNTAKNEIPVQYLDWKKARRILGWEPKVGFGEGVRRAFRWYKDVYFKGATNRK